ncbi:RDD family protein [Anaerobacillus sp. CMMVII]|nr:RDD family protein [Anaerobacillus sp. CMMVII]
MGFFYDITAMFFLWIMVGVLTTTWMITSSNSPSNDFAYIRAYILENEPQLFYTGIVIQILVLLLYVFVLPLTFKIPRSFGMMIAGTKLLKDNASEISRITYFKREIIKWVLFPGMILTLTKNKQSLADKLTKTYLTYY